MCARSLKKVLLKTPTINNKKIYYTKFKPHACARYLFSNMYQIVPKNKYKTDHRGWMNLRFKDARAFYNHQIW